jgi:predicted Rossmann fold nucleotide-binding protein DprA/Smf involved in DNA uptake
MLGHAALEAIPSSVSSMSTNMSNKTDKYENKLLLNAIGFDPVDMDTLVERTGLSVVELNRQLMELQLEGIISNQNGLYDRLE